MSRFTRWSALAGVLCSLAMAAEARAYELRIPVRELTEEVLGVADDPVASEAALATSVDDDDDDDKVKGKRHSEAKHKARKHEDDDRKPERRRKR